MRVPRRHRRRFFFFFSCDWPTEPADREFGKQCAYRASHKWESRFPSSVFNYERGCRKRFERRSRRLDQSGRKIESRLVVRRPIQKTDKHPIYARNVNFGTICHARHQGQFRYRGELGRPITTTSRGRSIVARVVVSSNFCHCFVVCSRCSKFISHFARKTAIHKNRGKIGTPAIRED